MNSRRGSMQWTAVIGGMLVGCLMAVLSVTYVLPEGDPSQPTGSVHAKNSATPDWILELGTRDARQMPSETVSDGAPSFWI